MELDTSMREPRTKQPQVVSLPLGGYPSLTIQETFHRAECLAELIDSLIPSSWTLFAIPPLDLLTAKMVVARSKKGMATTVVAQATVFLGSKYDMSFIETWCDSYPGRMMFFLEDDFSHVDL